MSQKRNNNEEINIDDLPLILQRARAAGVQKIYITGTNLEDSKESIEAIESNPDGEC